MTIVMAQYWPLFPGLRRENKPHFRWASIAGRWHWWSVADLDRWSDAIPPGAVAEYLP